MVMKWLWYHLTKSFNRTIVHTFTYFHYYRVSFIYLAKYLKSKWNKSINHQCVGSIFMLLLTICREKHNDTTSSPLRKWAVNPVVTVEVIGSWYPGWTRCRSWLQSYGTGAIVSAWSFGKVAAVSCEEWQTKGLPDEEWGNNSRTYYTCKWCWRVTVRRSIHMRCWSCHIGGLFGVSGKYRVSVVWCSIIKTNVVKMDFYEWYCC